MRNIKLVCDSLADLPKELIQKYDIEIVPLSVLFDGKEYIDGIDITKDEFYKMLRENKTLPKTSQVTYMSFKNTFERLINEAMDVLYIGGSSKISGTYQSAVMAKNDIEGNVYTFDSLSASIGGACIILSAARLINEGKSIEEIISYLEKLRDNTSVFFTVDTLEYLQKGGRISLTKAAIGNMLNIKPIIALEEGSVKSLSQARGKKQVISKILELLKQNHGSDLTNKHIVIGCGDNIDELEMLKKKIMEEFNIGSLLEVNIGSCICAHTGPSVLGIACSDK